MSMHYGLTDMIWTCVCVDRKYIKVNSKVEEFKQEIPTEKQMCLQTNREWKRATETETKCNTLEQNYHEQQAWKQFEWKSHSINWLN